jgi:hypothetical protein
MGFGANITAQMIHDFGPYGVGDGWPSLIHHGGDISYAGIDSEIKALNVTKDDEWEFIWDQYGHEMQPLTGHIPFMTTVGKCVLGGSVSHPPQRISDRRSDVSIWLLLLQSRIVLQLDCIHSPLRHAGGSKRRSRQFLVQL